MADLHVAEGDNNGATVLGQSLQGSDDLEGTGCIETSGWLIAKQHGWVGEQLHTNAGAPLLASTAAFVHRCPDASISALLQPKFENDLLYYSVALFLGRRWW